MLNLLNYLLLDQFSNRISNQFTMDAPLHHRQSPPFPNGTAAVDSPEKTLPEPSTSCTVEEKKPKRKSNKKKKKKQTLISDSASSASSNSCSCATSCSQKGFKISGNPKRIRVGSLTRTRISVGPSDVDALGLPLGMSIAAVVAQVFNFRIVFLFCLSR